MPGPDIEVDENYDESDDFIDPFLATTFQETADPPEVPLLFPGSRMSLRSFLAKIHYLKAKHALSDAAIGDFIEFFRQALPKPNDCPGTLYKLAKLTTEEFGSPHLEFERICSYCNGLLGEDNKCHERGCNLFDCSQQASYGFGKIGLKWQIKRILHGIS